MTTLYCIKIIVYKESSRVLVDAVAYYRDRLPRHLADKYRWYFDYLAALIKVKHPKRLVKVIVCPQDLPDPEQYKEDKIKNLIRHKKGCLKKLQSSIVVNDLFNYKEDERQAKIEKYKMDIESLERGEFSGWLPCKYINKIKRWK